MEIIGRRNEKKRLAALKDSGKPEFVAVYGRRRVGKTYLIREFFENEFAFYVTGVFRQSISFIRQESQRDSI